MIFQNDLIEKILDNIEDYESKLLAWGIVDVFQSKDEIYDIITNIIDNWDHSELSDHEDDASQIFNELIKRNLLFEVEEGQAPFYRTRMCETVRLLFNLRQMFPKHAKDGQWQNAPNLVADYRFIRRPRSYPRRVINTKEALSQLFNIIVSKNLKQAFEVFLNYTQNFKLAKFQLDSTVSIIKSFQSKYSSGILISAGTGSGKTLGFYISALSKIADNIIEFDNKKWTQCIAIYPRTELLKDQFSEIYNEARKLDKFLQNKGSRKIIIAPLFGDIPHSSFNFTSTNFKPPWKEKGDGFLCPFLKCPIPECKGDLIWSFQDIKQKEERLNCSKCSNVIDNSEVVFTRKTMEKHPPDILFTTTEMLNQNLSEAKYRKLFGIVKYKFKPEMILLDEVHTYNSTHGAQVAFLIRRLKNLIKSKITFVGLSATLVDANRFFSRLIQIEEYWVELITPKVKDMEIKGAEYMIALKGDPVSKSALLSTTIQTNMLLSRMIDNQQNSNSHGFFGKKVFAFTDDMDVTNRLFHQILDSEGRNDFGQEVAGKLNLATLREPNYSISKNKAGQNWMIPKIIQGSLDNKKSVSRVSSQDPGLDQHVDIVVATSSLEVGVDDPNVGAVLQHKTPRNMASFIQRKGRGGRSKYMRPWTSIILSDYGRDRLSYQSYDQLFNPELKIQPIPIESSYIQHIQSVYSLFDYIANELFSPDFEINWDNYDIDVWRDLSFPNNEDDSNKRRLERHKLIKDVLSKIISDPEELYKFKVYLKKSLSLSDDEVDIILWEHPRPVLTTAIPTAIRRLKTNWGKNINLNEPYIENSPLPEFIPSTLFGELNLPEVELILPNKNIGNEDNISMENEISTQEENIKKMPILQALNNFAPGKVSRRFGDQQSSHRHWLAPENSIEDSIEINEHSLSDFLGNWKYFQDDIEYNIPVYRPRKINLSIPPKEITDTSNAFLEWFSEFNFSQGTSVTVPKNTKISSIVSNIQAFTNGEQMPLEVRRFSKRSKAEIKYKRRDPEIKYFNFNNKSEKVALGFNMFVDAIKFSIKLPTKKEILNQINIDKELQKVLKTSRYFFLINQDSYFSSIENPFLRDWLGNVYYNMLIVETILSKCSLFEANERIKSKNNSITFSTLLNQLFQSHFIEKEDENSDADLNSETSIDKLREEIEDKLENPDVINELYSISSSLWSDFDESFVDWVQEKYLSTFSLSIISAIESFCRDIDTESLILDILPNNKKNKKENFEREFIISETSPGGLGIIENFLNLYSKDPRSFFSLTHSMFFPNDAELNDFQLTRLLSNLIDQNEYQTLQSSINSFRKFKSIQKKEDDFIQIKKSLRENSFILFHGFLTSMSNRILKPGSSFDTDFLLDKIVKNWSLLEKKLSIEIDSKIIAFMERNDTALDSVVQNLGFNAPDTNKENWRFNVIKSLLWSKGSLIRNQHLERYNPYQKFESPERLLFSNLITQKKDLLEVNKTEDWKKLAFDLLEKNKQITLKFFEEDKILIQDLLNFMTVNPIEDDYLSIYARLASLTKVENFYEVTIEIHEILQ